MDQMLARGRQMSRLQDFKISPFEDYISTVLFPSRCIYFIQCAIDTIVVHSPKSETHFRCYALLIKTVSNEITRSVHIDRSEACGLRVFDCSTVRLGLLVRRVLNWISKGSLSRHWKYLCAGSKSVRVRPAMSKQTLRVAPNLVEHTVRDFEETARSP